MCKQAWVSSLFNVVLGSQTLDSKLSETTSVSELSNGAAVSRACGAYGGCMRRVVRGGAVGAARLQAEHERAAAAARQDLADARSRHSDHPDSEDSFLQEILKVSLLNTETVSSQN